MEKQFFTWTTWIENDVADLTFFNCVLIQDIGTHKTSEVFCFIDVSYQSGTITFRDSEGNIIDSYKLLLSVGEKLS